MPFSKSSNERGAATRGPAKEESSSSTRTEGDVVVLGKVARAQGIHGDLRLALYNPGSDLWNTLERIVVRPKDGPARDAKILSRRRGPKNSLVVALDVVRDRTAAEALVGADICISATSLPALDEGELYERDLTGMTVADRGGKHLGMVEAVVAYPTVACLRVRCEDGVREIPLREPFVVLVDLERRTVTTGDLDDVPLEGR